MKTITITNPFEIALREQDRPVPGKGAALLKMRYGGICGTDLNIYRGTFAFASYPRIPGHEFSAEIVEAEPGTGLEPGMAVTANPYFNCGTCYSCQRGFVNCCTSNQTLGAQRDGIFSEYITLPAERIYDGRGLSAKTLALIEPFCISYHGVQRASVQPGDTVLVIGAGPIGIFAAMAAKHRGASVYVCDISEDRLAMASSFGADGVILNDSPGALEQQTAEITGGRGFDAVIEAVGMPGTFQNSIDAAAFRGRVVLIGISKQSLDFKFSVIQQKELDVYGSRNAVRKDFLELIDLVSKGVFSIDRMITDVYKASDAAKAFSDLHEEGGSKMKVLLEF